MSNCVYALKRERIPFFYASYVAKMLKDDTSELNFDDLKAACESRAFVDCAESAGLTGATLQVTADEYAGTMVYDRFVRALRSLDAGRVLALVFYGTDIRNIPGIFRDGIPTATLNRQRRRDQEYFGIDPRFAVSYISGATSTAKKEMIAFLVVRPDDDIKETTRRGIENFKISSIPPKHQLPVGVVSFKGLKERPWIGFSLWKPLVQPEPTDAESEFLVHTKRADVARKKAQIIQLLIIGRFDVAGELYQKHKDTICDTSKREISMYAHRFLDTDVCAFLFPGLPSPMTAQERDKRTGLRNVETLEKLASTAEKKLESEQQGKRIASTRMR